MSGFSVHAIGARFMFTSSIPRKSEIAIFDNFWRYQGLDIKSRIPPARSAGLIGVPCVCVYVSKRRIKFRSLKMSVDRTFSELLLAGNSRIY